MPMLTFRLTMIPTSPYKSGARLETKTVILITFLDDSDAPEVNSLLDIHIAKKH